MSHPVRTPPSHHHHHHHHHRNHHLNRIEEEPFLEDQTFNHHSNNNSSSNISINSEFYRTPNSTTTNHHEDGSSDEDPSDANHANHRHSINSTTSSSILLPSNQLLNKEVIQRKLRFYFMSPVDKWRIKRRFPFKLIFQFAKIIFVTMQIMYFGSEMSRYLNYEDNSRTAFREMLLQGWDPTRDIYAYPPSTGTFAVYTSEGFYDSVNYAIQQYSNLTDQSVGTFGYDPGNLGIKSSGLNQTPKPPQFPVIILEKQAFRQRYIDPSKYIFNFNDEILTDERIISDLFPAGDPAWLTFNAQEYFRKVNFTINFDTLISLRMRFPLRTIYFNADVANTVRCYDLNVTIWYDNQEHDGEIPVSLNTERRVHQCKSQEVLAATRPPKTDESPLEELEDQISIYRQYYGSINWSLALNWSVIVFCTFSIILCIRSIYRGQLLRAETDQFFHHCFERHLQFSESMEFCDLWIVMIGINDVLIICGTLMKIKLESSDIISGTVYTDCSLLLGIGNLLVWLGMLRYLSYFASYNILIITVQKSIPNILRFLFCATLIYSGFCFCGWVVLGPYHLKFRTLSSTSECLFSLMNGDDMFATFFSTDVKSHNVIWWFSRIYFYLFISLAIYVIVSLFIAIILDSYESIRDYYAKEPEDLKSPLQKFIEEYPIDSVDGSNFTNNSIVDQFYRHVTSLFTFRRR